MFRSTSAPGAADPEQVLGGRRLCPSTLMSRSANQASRSWGVPYPRMHAVFDVLEELLGLLAHARLGHDQVAPHVDDLGDVLDVDRALGLTGAARAAAPDFLLQSPTGRWASSGGGSRTAAGNVRRQRLAVAGCLREGPNIAGPVSCRFCFRSWISFRELIQRHAAQGGRAHFFAAPAVQAGVQVEQLLPVELIHPRDAEVSRARRGRCPARASMSGWRQLAAAVEVAQEDVERVRRRRVESLPWLRYPMKPNAVAAWIHQRERWSRGQARAPPRSFERATRPRSPRATSGARAGCCCSSVTAIRAALQQEPLEEEQRAAGARADPVVGDGVQVRRTHERAVATVPCTGRRRRESRRLSLNSE